MTISKNRNAAGPWAALSAQKAMNGQGRMAVRGVGGRRMDVLEATGLSGIPAIE